MKLKMRKVSVRREDASEFEFDVKFAVLGGYSARSVEVRNQHIEELRVLDIEPPDETPAFWPIATSMVVTDSHIEVQGSFTSGEIEFALLVGADGTFVSLASDQTDREFEVHSIPRSKQMCPKVLSRDVIAVEELAPVWDEIVISSEVREAGGSWRPYQREKLSAIMTVEDLLGSAFPGAAPPVGTVLLSGTVPLLDGVTTYADAFRGQLEVPGWDGRLTVSYEIEALPAHSRDLLQNTTGTDVGSLGQ